jgi:hypothetical protein
MVDPATYPALFVIHVRRCRLRDHNIKFSQIFLLDTLRPEIPLQAVQIPGNDLLPNILSIRIGPTDRDRRTLSDGDLKHLIE